METLKRDYKFDNMRFILMFLVVLGHMLELFLTGFTLYLYKIIYSFHIPVLIFITGKYAKFDKIKVLKHLLLPYFVFQLIYTVFSAKIITNSGVNIQFTTPYWILWYLLAIIFYYMLVPVLPNKNSLKAFILIVVSIILSLIIGYDKTVGYYLTLSRFFVFLPFFLVGYYYDLIVKYLNKFLKINKILKIVLLLLIIVIFEFVLLKTNVSIQLLYGSYAYKNCNGTVFERFTVLLTAFCVIALLCTVLTDKKLPVISSVGKNTMPIFILHAVTVKLLGKFEFFKFSEPVNLLLAIIISLAVMILLGNKYVSQIFKTLF